MQNVMTIMIVFLDNHVYKVNVNMENVETIENVVGTKNVEVAIVLQFVGMYTQHAEWILNRIENTFNICRVKQYALGVENIYSI